MGKICKYTKIYIHSASCYIFHQNPSNYLKFGTVILFEYSVVLCTVNGITFYEELYEYPFEKNAVFWSGHKFISKSFYLINIG